MEHYKTVVVPETAKQVLEKTTCDLCGACIRPVGAEEVEVRHRTGDAYPGAGWGDETIVDMCGGCFEEKLIPWLKSQGVKPVTKDWSF